MPQNGIAVPRRIRSPVEKKWNDLENEKSTLTAGSQLWLGVWFGAITLFFSLGPLG